MLLSASGHGLFAFGDERFSVTNNYHNNDGYSDSFSLRKKHFLLQSHPKQIGYIGDKSMYDTCGNKQRKNSIISNGLLSYGTRKKRVSFADDRGFDLVEVREIPGSGGSASRWADNFLTLLMGRQKPTDERNWKIAFEHPPWNDEGLEMLLKQNGVVLESVSVDGHTLSGKIKVTNLAYEKDVFLRITFDRWVSHTDIKAAYVYPKPKLVKVQNIYDNFTFNLDIPQSAFRYDVVEFCIGYKCNGEKHWDNNGGINYRLTTVTETPKPNTTEVSLDKTETPKVTFSVTANFDEFSEIGAWNPFMYNRPYW